MDLNNPLIFAIPGAIIIAIVFFLFFKKTAHPQKLTVKLIDKKHITHDSIVFTFLLPDQKRTLGLKIGEHI